MNNFNPFNVRRVFNKELLDTFRDKEVIFTIIVMPLVIYPVLIFVLIQSSMLVTNKWIDESYTVGVLEEQQKYFESIEGDKKYSPTTISRTLIEEQGKLFGLNNDLSSLQDEMDDLECKNSKDTGCADKRKLIEKSIKDMDKSAAPIRTRLRTYLKEKKLDFIAYYKESKEQRVIHFIANESVRKSQRALKYFKRRVKKLSIAERKVRLSKLNLSMDFFDPFASKVTNVASKGMGLATKLGSGIGAYILFLFVLSMLYPSANTVFDEKENKTLRVLLLSPLSSLELVLGKFFSVAFFGLVGFIPYVILGIGGVFFFYLKFDRPEVLEILRINQPILLVMGLFSAALLLASTMLFVSTLAKSKKAAQSFLSIFMMCVLFPAYILNLFDLRLEVVNSFIPFFSSVLYFKGIVGGTLKFPEIFTFFVFNSIYTVMMIALILKSYDFRGQLENRASDLIKLLSTKKRKEVGLSPSLSFVASFICIGWILFHSSSLSEVNASWHYLARVVSINIGVPLLFVLAYFRPNFKASFPVKMKSPLPLLMAVALVFCAQPTVLWLMSNVIPADAFKDFAGILGGQDEHIALKLFAMAIIPAVLEELFFRGIVLQGFLKRFGPTFAVVFSALFFALAHCSLIRFIPTFALGLIMGHLVIRYGSLLPAMLFHFFNNGIAVIADHYKWDYLAKFTTMHFVGVTVLLFILFAIMSYNKKRESLIVNATAG